MSNAQRWASAAADGQKTRRDDAPLESAITCDDVELGGGAGVDDQQRSAVELKTADRIQQAVDADRTRIRQPHLDFRVHGLADHQRLEHQVPSRQSPQRVHRRGRYTRYDAALDISRVEAIETQELLETVGMLFSGRRCIRGDTPSSQNVRAMAHRKNGVAVALFNCQQHA